MLAVAGGTGGCGKTTSALGVARALARTGAEPLVVGADTAMLDLYLQAGVQSTPSADAVAAGADPRDVIHREGTGVAMFPVGRAPTGQVLPRLRGWKGPVLVDCPPGCGERAVAPLRACDRALLVTTGIWASVGNTHKTARLARRTGAPPSGAVVRTAPDGERPVEFQVTGPVVRVPTVLAPLSAPQVRSAHARLVKGCSEQRTGAGPVPRGRPIPDNQRCLAGTF